MSFNTRLRKQHQRNFISPALGNFTRRWLILRQLAADFLLLIRERAALAADWAWREKIDQQQSCVCFISSESKANTQTATRASQRGFVRIAKRVHAAHILRGAVYTNERTQKRYAERQLFDATLGEKVAGDGGSGGTPAGLTGVLGDTWAPCCLILEKDCSFCEDSSQISYWSVNFIFLQIYWINMINRVLTGFLKYIKSGRYFSRSLLFCTNISYFLFSV